MAHTKSAVSLAIVLTSSAAWLLIGSLWYVCVTQELCSTAVAEDTASQSQTSTQPAQQTTPAAQQPPTQPAQQQPVQPTPTPTPEPTTPAFDTEQTVVVLFQPNSAEFLDRTWQNDLNKIIAYLKDNRTEKVTVAGYVAILSPGQTGDSLSLQRAKAVEAYMIERGVTQAQITSVSRQGTFGDQNTEDGRKQNRRAVVSFN